MSALKSLIRARFTLFVETFARETFANDHFGKFLRDKLLRTAIFGLWSLRSIHNSIHLFIYSSGERTRDHLLQINNGKP